ncbi:MAG: response regulator [Bacteroidales bacterium]|nr:response regulator [Bacteroidales bacterium]
MSKIKILIVEDELIIAEDMKEMLRELEYSVIGVACDYNEAEDLLEKELPDIALIDIQLRGNIDGISLAQSIKEKNNLPVIFVTSHSDKATVERAKLANPDGYIVKPFDKKDLFTSVEIALSNFLKSKSLSPDKETDNYIFNEYIFVKHKFQFEKIRIHDIIWIKSEGNYLEMHCTNQRKFLIRSTFIELFQNIKLKSLLQVHKSYAVNFEYIDSVRPNEILIDKTTIPIGKMYKENIRKNLNIIF